MASRWSASASTRTAATRRKGLLRERFIPRLLAAKPEDLLDGSGLIDPEKAWGAMMKNEKPGGHQFALNIALGLGLGGNESYLTCSRPSAASRTERRSRMDASACRTCRESASRP